MRISTSLATLSVLLGATTSAGAQTRPVQGRPDPIPAPIQGAALQFEQQVKARKVQGSARDVLAEARKLASTPATRAQAPARFLDAAHLDIDNPAIWIELAEALLALPANDKTAEARTHALNATAAATLSYRRAKTPTDRARALTVVSRAFEKRGQHRTAITTLRAALVEAPTADRQSGLKTLIAAHGFRYMDYSAETDSARPRLCLKFSEDLPTEKIDLDTFVSVNGKAPPAARIEGRQICIDGLAHGERYQVRVKAGLPSVHPDEPLTADVDVTVFLRDRTASVRAVGRAYVLPSTGQHGVPLVSINAERLAVDVYRIGDRGLVPFLERHELGRQINRYELATIREQSGRRVYEGTLDVSRRNNEEVTTAFPVSEAIGRLEPGVYVLAAQPFEEGRKRSTEQATQWFIVTDIGISTFAASDGLHIATRSLATAQPKPGLRVRLIAKSNEILAETTTGADGFARFDPALLAGDGALQPQMVTVEGGGDYAFLDIAQAAFDLTDRGVKGRPAPGPIDAFAYTDRGVYRPGETVHLAALVRDRAARANTVPVMAVVTRPDGVEHARISLADQGLGGRTHALKLGRGSMTGTWRVKVITEPKAPPIAQVAFLVEEFVPEKIELTITPKVPELNLERGAPIDVAGRYLYGPPAAGLAIEGEVVVKASKSGLAAFPDFRFGATGEKFETVRQAYETLGATGQDGTLRLDVKLPAVNRTSIPLEADLILKLRESGGRTVERVVTLPVAADRPRIGIKPRFEGTNVREGTTAAFDVIGVGPDLKRMALPGARWELLRLEQRWQWYNRDGNWSYDVHVDSRRVAGDTFDLKAEDAAVINARVDWGRYRLVVRSADDQILSSMNFEAGYWAEEGADSPETLDVALDKSSYRVGEIARVRIASRMPGRALVTVMSGGLLDKVEVDVPAGGGDVALPVKADWGPGAYIGVSLFRPLDQPAKRMPSRAIGVSWLSIDQAPRRLAVALEAPKEIKPNQALIVPLKLEGLAPGEEARVTVSAVDVGILNLTRFEQPKPESWFHGQRKLGVDVRDFYSRLIDGMRAEKGRLRSGGDGAAPETMSSAGAKPVEVLLAEYSGIVKVGPDGRAEVRFDLPQFNGTVRLSAVAWSADKVGSGSTDVVVRDDLAVTIATPRFLTVGDKARLAVDVHNVTSTPQTFNLSLKREDMPVGVQPIALTDKRITLAPGQRMTESVVVEARDVGPMPLSVSLMGDTGLRITRPLNLSVKPPAGDIRRATVVNLQPGTGTLSLTPDLASELIPSTVRVTVNVGPLAELDVPGLLAELDRYPYGCAEQTTSRALPLLYANEIARRVGLGTDQALKARIDDAIARVLDMQSTSGAFGIWGPTDGDIWLTSYVSEFLLRAKEQGFAVPPRALTQALDRLRNSVVNRKDNDTNVEGRAYALYVLARGGRGMAGELRYDTETRLSAFKTPMEKAQLGAALRLMGDQPRAEQVFTRAVAQPSTDVANNLLRTDYGSRMRDTAAVAALAAESQIKAVDVTRLLADLARARQTTQWTSTQEQAWLVMAARAVDAAATQQSLKVNGEDHRGAFQRGYGVDALKATPVTITNTGEQPTSAVVTVLGASLTAEPAVSRGFTLKRTFYTLDGKPVDLASATGGTSEVRQNDRFVVVVEAEAQSNGGRILVVDKLPAGLEIENPRLVEAGNTKSLPWLDGIIKPEHAEFRDDRMMAAFNLSGRKAASTEDGDDDEPSDATSNSPRKTVKIAYIVRAVTPGTYVHPAATVEDMYRPERHARTAQGRLTVK